MPTKNMELVSGTLYLNNEPIMELDKCDLVCDEPIYADEIPKRIKFSEMMEGELELTNVKVNRNALLSLLFGRKITNNWLKKHGGIMTRKKGKRYV